MQKQMTMHRKVAEPPMIPKHSIFFNYFACFLCGTTNIFLKIIDGQLTLPSMQKFPGACFALELIFGSQSHHLTVSENEGRSQFDQYERA